MKIARFIIALFLITLVTGCSVEKKESLNAKGKEAAVSMDQAITLLQMGRIRDNQPEQRCRKTEGTDQAHPQYR